MRGQHANRQGAAVTVGRLLGRIRAELAAERVVVAAEWAAYKAQSWAKPSGRHAKPVELTNSRAESESNCATVRLAIPHTHGSQFVVNPASFAGRVRES